MPLTEKQKFELEAAKDSITILDNLIAWDPQIDPELNQQRENAKQYYASLLAKFEGSP
jgi:hypothetical protein